MVTASGRQSFGLWFSGRRRDAAILRKAQPPAPAVSRVYASLRYNPVYDELTSPQWYPCGVLKPTQAALRRSHREAQTEYRMQPPCVALTASGLALRVSRLNYRALHMRVPIGHVACPFARVLLSRSFEARPALGP